LGAVTFSRTRSLFVDLRSSLVSGVLKGLIDSGFSDCFLDSKFMISNKLKTRQIDLLPLTLIDGTVNCYVNQVVSLPIQLPCGSSCVIECYVTPLGGSYEVVLGHNWLREWNPTIDWLGRTVTLPNPPKPEPVGASKAPNSPEPPIQLLTPPSTNMEKPHISLINAAAYRKACKMQGCRAANSGDRN